MTINSNPKLHIAKALLGAFVVPWHQRRTFARALTVPMICMVVLMVVWYQTYESLPNTFGWIVWVAYILMFVLVAVICHRIVLLDQRVENAWAFPRWTWRESRFLGWGAFVSVAAMLIFWLTLTIAGTIGANLPGSSEGNTFERMKAVEYVADLVYWYFFARFSLVFPAIAVDEVADLSLAWNRSRGNGWRLFVVVCVLPFCISQLISYMYRAEPSLVEYVVLTWLATVLLTVEIAALSLSYRQLANTNLT